MRPAQFVAPLVLSLALMGCNAKTPPDRSAADQTLEAPPWDAGLTRQLADAIDKRRAHGLDKLPFEAPTRGQDDAALTKAALAYASALARGASDPHKLFEIYTLPRPEPDLKRGLAQAMADRKVGDWLEGLGRRRTTTIASSPKPTSPWDVRGRPRVLLSRRRRRRSSRGNPIRACRPWPRNSSPSTTLSPARRRALSTPPRSSRRFDGCRPTTA